MTDTTINPDAVWVSDMATELAASTGGDYLAQVSAAKTILSELVFAIHAGELPVYVLGVAGMVERPARNQEAGFPYGDYRLRRATAQAWIASQSTIPALPVEPLIPKNKRPDLLVPLIESAQRQTSDPFNAAVIWPLLCGMAENRTKPFHGKTEEGIQWIDGNDDVQYFNLKMLRDRLSRQVKSRDITR